LDDGFTVLFSVRDDAVRMINGEPVTINDITLSISVASPDNREVRVTFTIDDPLNRSLSYFVAPFASIDIDHLRQPVYFQTLSDGVRMNSQSWTFDVIAEAPLPYFYFDEGFWPVTIDTKIAELSDECGRIGFQFSGESSSTPQVYTEQK
jgi:hypothetical protein